MKKIIPAFIFLSIFAIRSYSFTGEHENVVEMEKIMFGFINQEREKYDLSTLKFDTSLCEIARVHSRNMAESSRVAHELPGYPNLGERIKDAGLKVLKHGENVASAPGIVEAHENFMQSPPHRKSILDGDFTHIGIGIIKKKDFLYITQNFVSYIPELTPSEGRKILLLRIREITKSPLRENPELSSIAQLHSEKMAVKMELLQTDILKGRLLSSKIRFSRAFFMVVSAPTIEQVTDKLKENKDIRSVLMKEVGLGLRQSDDGNLWVSIILIAHRR